MTAANKIVIFVKALAADAKIVKYGNIFDCVFARALNRRLKKNYYCTVGTALGYIYNQDNTLILTDNTYTIAGEGFTQEMYEDMKTGKRGDMVLKVTIDPKYLKRVHKPRVKKVVPMVPTLAEKQLAQVRQAADVLDKVFPKWKEVDTTDCDMTCIHDCLLMRIAKLHGDTKGWWSDHMRVMTENGLVESGTKDADCVFASQHYLAIWEQVIAERKAAEEAAKPKFDRPGKVDMMRKAAKVLDKIFPNWRKVSLDNLDMLSGDDCLLVRIARLHSFRKELWGELNEFIQQFHDCPPVFNDATTPHDWAIIIAEGKQD